MKTRFTFLSLALSAVLALGCSQSPPRYEIRGFSEGFRISVSADSLPPHAQDDVHWRMRVQDSKTGQAIEGGQGRIWARNKDGHVTQSGFTQAPELGTYTATLSLVMAGQWAMGVQFRRDSLSPFAIIDWLQEVKGPRPLGGGEIP
jgi:hypothetical protein